MKSFRYSRGLLVLLFFYFAASFRHVFIGKFVRRWPTIFTHKSGVESLTPLQPLELQGLLKTLGSDPALGKQSSATAGSKQSSLPPVQRAQVLRRFGDCVEACEPQLLADCLWRLGSLGFSVHADDGLFSDADSIVPRALRHLRNSVDESVNPSRAIGDVALSKLFIGLARLDVTLDSYQAPLSVDESAENPFTSLVEIFKLSLPSLGPQSLSNALWAMTEMRVRRTHLSPSLRRDILERIYSLSPSLGDQALSMVLWSLFKLGYSWSRYVLYVFVYLSFT